MKKKLLYFSLFTIPMILMSLHLEINSINLADVIILIYFFILIYSVSKNKELLIIIRGNNQYFYLYIIWILIVLVRGTIYNFSTEEGILGNILIQNYVGYIDDRTAFMNFFRIDSSETHLLTFIRLVLAMVVYYIGVYFANKINGTIPYIKLGLLLSIVINVILSLEQLILDNRASGLLGHAQDLSSLGLMYIALEITEKKKNYIGIFLAVIAIYFSETRSAYFAFVLLLLTVYFENVNIPKITILGTLISTLIVSFFIDAKQFILNIIGFITDPWDLMIRFELWSKVFAEISIKNLFFGANLFPSFTDNIIWYIVMPTGYIGLFLFIMMFIKDAKIAKRGNNVFKQNFIVILFGQGLLFNGFLGEYTIFMWFFIYGIIYKSESMENRNLE
ncbi:hypothetical protein [Metabacillus halosaccharovorans]|uniref:hypothetical protein n=1 Tax=Metabacillus halosaccharovorans TaxID=930124 RepID=UPI001C1F7F73|nr:hypothetical protein [Metabacillus halosaccharovorans]MBU7594458.1 hypothetical protein [Metabacillus halosaccharovorans]